jgi:hypothetical protein
LDGFLQKADEKNASAYDIGMKNLQWFSMAVGGYSLKHLDFVDFFNNDANGLFFASSRS